MIQEEVVVDTGNILHSEHLKKRVNLGPQEELVDCIRDALKSSNTLVDGPTTELRQLQSGDRSSDLFTDEERNDLKITVKLFLTDASKDSVSNAVRASLQHLQIKTIDLLLVSLPSNAFSDFEEAWRTLEDVVKSGKAESIGVSDFSFLELEKLFAESNVKPSVNQVNLESCCVIPPELSEFAKKNNIQLLTHNDPRVMLEDDIVADIFKSFVPPLVAADWRASWLLRYTAMVKLRGVVKSRGFVFAMKKIRT